MGEAFEISESHPEIQFILKPVKGSGGYDINLLNNEMEIEFGDGEFILQEYVTGISLSSSVLSSEDESKTVTNSRLLTMNDFGKENSFIYVGNILPLTEKSIMADTKDIENITRQMQSTSEDLIDKFGLVGSNGVDYILSEDGLHVIEINPRLQGTFECVERSFGINMLEAHIKACLGEVMEIPEAKRYTYKKIIYSPTRNRYQKLDLDNIYDLPHIGSITEKDEPLLTIIDSDANFDRLYEKVELTGETVNRSVKRSQADAQ
jgi:hypothetical protein